MFVQSHIQRTRHQPGSTSSASASAAAASSASHQHHHKHASHSANHHHNHQHTNNNHHHHQQQQQQQQHNKHHHREASKHSPSLHSSQGSGEHRATVAKSPASHEGSKRDRRTPKQEESARATNHQSGPTSGRHNSFFIQEFNHDDLIRALEELDESGELIERIANARDDAELLEQVELVESKLIARRTGLKQDFKRAESGNKASLKVEFHTHRISKSISLIDLNISRQEAQFKEHRDNLRQRSTTINSVLKKSVQESCTNSLVVDSNDKWTQVNGSLRHLDSFEHSRLAQPATNETSSTSGGILDLSRTLWNLWLTRAATAVTSGAEERPESRVSLRKNLRLVAWFWVNFIAFQYETLKEIYHILRARRSATHSSHTHMAASRSEYSPSVIQTNGLHHHYSHKPTNCYSHSARDGVYTSRNPSIAPVGSIEPRILSQCEHQNQLYDLRQDHDHQQQAHRLNHYHSSHYQPNHVHVHNHTSLAGYYAPERPPIVDYECAYHAAAALDRSVPNRSSKTYPAQHSQSVAAPVQRPNQLIRHNVIAMQQQQEILVSSPEPRWQWNLRHTVDGSPVRTSCVQAAAAAAGRTGYCSLQEHNGAISTSAHSNRQGHFLASHRASVSSPTLLEPHQQLNEWHQRPEVQLLNSQVANGVAKTARAAVDWQLGYSSDELSVISDHELSLSASGADQRILAPAQQLPVSRRPQSLATRRGQFPAWSSMDSEQSTNRLNGQRALAHRAAETARRTAPNRLVAQWSLTTQHTSSMSGLSVSPATSCQNNQPSERLEIARRGLDDSSSQQLRQQQTQEQQQQQQQQQQVGRRRVSPLTKVSLAGAKRRLGFKRRGGGLNSLSVHRSEEVFPSEAAGNTMAAPPPLPQTGLNALSGVERRRQYANTTGSSSLNDSSLESTIHHNSSVSRSPWFNQFRASPDPKVCFVEGLGAGQIASRQALVSPYLGDIQLGLSDRRGMLEVEVIRVRQLQLKPAAKRVPSPYVKVYLMRDKKCLAKFKTTQVRETLDPLYQQQFIFRDDYSNCLLQVIVWGDYGKKDKKSLMGVVQIYINDLDMSNLVIGWYKLFNAPSMMNSSLASNSKVLRQTMSSSRLATDFSLLPSWQVTPSRPTHPQMQATEVHQRPADRSSKLTIINPTAPDR